jgi:hypothetical protein
MEARSPDQSDESRNFVSRRQLLHFAGSAGLAITAGACSHRPIANASPDPSTTHKSIGHPRNHGGLTVPRCVGRPTCPVRGEGPHHHPDDSAPRGRGPRRQPQRPGPPPRRTSTITKTSWDGSTSRTTSASTATATSMNCGAPSSPATPQRTTTPPAISSCSAKETSIKRLCRRPSCTEPLSHSHGPPRTLPSRPTRWRATGT